MARFGSTAVAALILAWPGIGAARPPSPGDEPVPGGATADPAQAKQAAEGDEDAQVAARNIDLAQAEGKAWTVTGRVQFRTLVITDEDPANGRLLDYRLQASYALLEWLQVLARTGINQRFVAQPGESGVRMQDTLLAGVAIHSLSLKGIGLDRDVSFLHRLGVFLPTSFESQQQDLYLAPELLSQARVRLFDQVFFGLTGVFQYRFHKYAERAGYAEGGTLPRVVLAGLSFLEYTPLASKTFGSLTVGGDIYGYEIVHYPSHSQASVEQVSLPQGVSVRGEDLIGDQASTVHVSQQYGYDLYLTYVPPLPDHNLALTVSWEQGGRVLRDGVVNMFGFHRDETTLAFTLTARY